MCTSPKSKQLALACFSISALFISGLITITTDVRHVVNNQLPPTVNAPSERQAAPVDEETRERVSEAYGKLPLSFEENRGQVDAEVRYVSRGVGYTLFLTPAEAVLSLRSGGGEARGEKQRRRPRRQQSAVLRMRLKNANPAPAVKGESEMGARANYFIGNDPKNWHTDVARFERVRYSQLYPGIDMIYYGQQRQLEYDFEVAPGVDSSQIALEFAGVRRMRIERATGDLVLTTGGGEVRQRRPVSYQETGGERREVLSRYVLKGEREVGIEVGEYDRTKPLVIDPVLTYSTHLGGSFYDSAAGIAVDSAGNAYVVGGTSSTDFPLLHPYQVKPEVATSGAVFVTKLTETVFIGGRVTRADKTGVGSVTVTLTGTQNRTTTTNAAGEYSFRNLPSGGTYSVTVSKGGLTFLQAKRSFYNLQVNLRGANFATTPATISGRVNADSGAGLAGVTVTLTGGAEFTPRTAVTAADGTYSFTNLPTPHSYHITPSKLQHYTFAPAQLALLNITADQPETNFAATLKSHTISGVVRFGWAAMAGVTVYLSSPTSADFTTRKTTTTSTGTYSFANLPAGGNYFVRSNKPGYQFTPQYLFWNLNGNEAWVNFNVERHSVSGRVTRAGTTTGIGWVTVTLTSPTPAGFAARTAQTNSNGYYTFTNLPAGRDYILKPAKSGFTFSPTTRSITDLSGNIPPWASTSFTGTGP